MKKPILLIAILSLFYVTVNAQSFNTSDEHSTFKERKQKVLTLLRDGFTTSYKAKQETESKIDSVAIEGRANGEWITGGSLKFSYSEKNPQQTLLFKFLSDDGNLITEEKIEWYKSTGHRVDSILSYVYSNGEFELTTFDKYFYDNEQRLDSNHYYGDSDSYFTFTHSTADSILYTYTNTYVAEGEKQTVKAEGYFLNKNNNLYDFYEYDNGDKYRDTYFNFSFDKMVQATDEYYIIIPFEFAEWIDDDYITTFKTTYVYNDDTTQLVSGKDQYLSNGNWVNDAVYKYTYTNDLLSIIETIEYDTDDTGSIVADSTRELISYKNITSNDSEFILDGYKLSQNYPNPFNPNTIINFSIPASSNVSIEIYNMLGQKVSTILNEFKIEGSHQIKFDASSLPSGVYMYQLRADAFVETKLMTLIK